MRSLANLQGAELTELRSKLEAARSKLVHAWMGLPVPSAGTEKRAYRSLIEAKTILEDILDQDA